MAGGLVAWAGPDDPVFCADAVADPISGLFAGFGGLVAGRAGGGLLVDVSMSDASAATRSGPACDEPHAVERDAPAAGACATGQSPRWSSPPPRPRRRTVTDLVVTRADLGDGRVADVRVSGGRIVGIAANLAIEGTDRLLDAAGGAVIPGLHDHHVHLYAMAAARRSLDLGSAAVAGPGRLEAVLRQTDRRLAPGTWLRGVGYHDRVAGPLDRHRLDRIVPDRPVKIQHRSGHQWTLNSRALVALQDLAPAHPGIERDPSGSPTGRLHGMDRVIDAAGGREAPCLGVRASGPPVSG